MKHPQWSEIFYLFKEIEQQKASLKEKKPSPETISTTRQSMIVSLNQLRNNLRQMLDEHSVHLVFFWIVSYLDEEMQIMIAASQNEWATLQKHFFNITNAGELFFENLDEALEKPEFPSIVFETAYFILKKGFKGKYEKSPNRLAKYMDFLSENIESIHYEKKEKGTAAIHPLFKPKIKIWQFYGAAAVVTLLLFIALNLHSNL